MAREARHFVDEAVFAYFYIFLVELQEFATRSQKKRKRQLAPFRVRSEYRKVFPQKPAYKNQGYSNSAPGAQFSLTCYVNILKTLPKIFCF